MQTIDISNRDCVAPRCLLAPLGNPPCHLADKIFTFTWFFVYLLEFGETVFWILARAGVRWRLVVIWRWLVRDLIDITNSLAISRISSIEKLLVVMTRCSYSDCKHCAQAAQLQASTVFDCFVFNDAVSDAKVFPLRARCRRKSSREYPRLIDRWRSSAETAGDISG